MKLEVFTNLWSTITRVLSQILSLRSLGRKLSPLRFKGQSDLDNETSEIKLHPVTVLIGTISERDKSDTSTTCKFSAKKFHKDFSFGGGGGLKTLHTGTLVQEVHEKPKNI